LSDPLARDRSGDRRPDETEGEEKDDPKFLPRFETLRDDRNPSEGERAKQTEKAENKAGTLFCPKPRPVQLAHVDQIRRRLT
jgi:hypothetical protein